MQHRRTLRLAAATVAASIPGFVLIFVLWGRAGLSEAGAKDPAAVAAFAHGHPALYAALPLLGVLMHLAAALLVIAFHRPMLERSNLWGAFGSLAGAFWIVSDLLQNLGHYYANLSGLPVERAVAVSAAMDALWHAGHMGGGIWILCIAALGDQLFGRAYRTASSIVGLVFAAHPLVFPLWPAWFGLEMLLVPIWGVWTAMALGAACTPVVEAAHAAA